MLLGDTTSKGAFAGRVGMSQTPRPWVQAKSVWLSRLKESAETSTLGRPNPRGAQAGTGLEPPQVWQTITPNSVPTYTVLGFAGSSTIAWTPALPNAVNPLPSMLVQVVAAWRPP